MFDLRYHVASLAAVFFALVIGILVGVALASHGLGNTERNRLEEDLRRAESQSESLNTTVDALTKRGKAEHAYVEATYKNVMANRLKGKKIALLFVGSADSHMRAFVARALGDAGAGPATPDSCAQCSDRRDEARTAARPSIRRSPTTRASTS